MTKQIKQVIDELIKIEPSLASKTEELELVLQELMAAKGSIDISDTFVSELKQRVLATEPAQTPIQLFLETIHMHTKHIALGTAGVVAVAAFAIGAYTLYSPTGPTALVTNQAQTIALGPNAFGSLGEAYTNDPAPAPQAAMLGAEAAISSRSMAANPVVGFGGGGMAVTEPAMADKMMIMPYYSYAYAYIGDDISLPTDLPVYRRSLNNGSVAQSMAAAIRSVDTGMISLPSGLRAENLNLRTNDGDGFSYHIDLRTQTVNIYEETSVYNDNWNGRTTLPDATLIRLATSFLEGRGVDLAAYGEPVVDIRYTRWQSEGSIVPQQLTVLFPIITPSGETVYERNGDAPAGIGVTVDQARQTAVSAYNIKRMQFESSAYELATDISRVLEVATQGGDVYEPWRPEDAEVATFTLGTPTVVYIEYYQYNDRTGTSDELYIPALRFPIVDRPEQEVYYNPEFVTVPLVAELLKAPVVQPEPYPMPRPMPVEPLEAPAVEPAIIENPLQ